MDRHLILTLQNIPGIGYSSIEKAMLLPEFSKIRTPLDIVSLLEKAKKIHGRISVPEVDVVSNAWDKSNEIIKKSGKLDIKIISKYSEDYPRKLLRTNGHPHLLHVKGNIKLLNGDCVAVVGSRTPTEYGVLKTKEITSFLVNNDYSIVSGLAEGIDTIAHSTALASGGVTIAVLAHGLDTIYPKVNNSLADAIIQNRGALVSEYPIGTKAIKSNFVNRDRIQSGLSSGIIVIQSSLKSGTIHTASFCKEQKRMLCVLKAPLNSAESSRFTGNQKLIDENLVDIIIENAIDTSFLNKLRHQQEEKEVSKSSYQSTLWI